MSIITALIMVFTLIPSEVFAEGTLSAPYISGITRDGTDALVIDWQDDNDDVVKYVIYCSEDESMGNARKIVVKDGDARTKRIGKLNSYTKYYFSMKAVTADGDSELSKIRSKTTGIKTPVLKTKSKGAEYISVSWSRGEKGIKGYEIQYRKNGKNTKKIKIGSRKTTSKKIGELYPYTGYSFRIRAVGDKMRSKWSSWKNTRTKKAGRKYLQNLIENSSSKSKVTAFNTDYRIRETKKGKKLIKHLSKMKRKYKVSIVVIDLYSGAGFSSSSHTKMYSASCLKGPYVAAINKYIPNKANRYRSKQKQTIVQSNNMTYFALRSAFGKKVIRKYCRRAGSTSYVGNNPYAYVLPKDLGKLWVENYWYFFRDRNKNSKKTRRLYTHGTLAFIEHALKATVYTKPGWYPGSGLDTYNDAGIVMSRVNGKTRPYVVVVMSKGWGHKKELKKLVQLINSVHKDMVSE